MIYLNPYYEAYSKGKIEIEQAVDNVVELYNQSKIDCGNVANDMIDNVFKFENVKDRLRVRVINFEANKEYLSNKPYEKVLDLAKILYIALDDTNMVGANAAIIIEDTVFESWGISKEDVFDIAWSNTMKALPQRIGRMSDILQDFCSDISLIKGYRESSDRLYVVSNSEATYGAGAILYKGVAENIANSLNSDIIILPCSVHETIILAETNPAVEKDYKELKAMVQYINEKELSRQNYLSNSVYRYSRELDKIEIVA